MKKSPIVCPSCATVFDPDAVLRPRRSRAPVEPVAPKPVPVAVVADKDDDNDLGLDDADDDDDTALEDTSDLGDDDDVPVVGKKLGNEDD